MESNGHYQLLSWVVKNDETIYFTIIAFLWWNIGGSWVGFKIKQIDQSAMQPLSPGLLTYLHTRHNPSISLPVMQGFDVLPLLLIAMHTSFDVYKYNTVSFHLVFRRLHKCKMKLMLLLSYFTNRGFFLCLLRVNKLWKQLNVYVSHFGILSLV